MAGPRTPATISRHFWVEKIISGTNHFPIILTILIDLRANLMKTWWASLKSIAEVAGNVTLTITDFERALARFRKLTAQNDLESVR